MDSRSSILFVDDEERVVNLLKRVFHGAYEVHTATSGAAALEILATHRIDVLVSDQRMPQMLGTELLKAARDRSPATMRILLTGYSDLAAIVGSVNEGEIYRFLNKPWDHEELKRVVAQAAAAAATTRALLGTAGATAGTAPLEAEAQADAPDLPGVLLIDEDERDRSAIAGALGDQFTVHGAANIPQALKVLEDSAVGVIVSEARVGGRDAGELLRVLKQQYPQITTVLLTKSADSDLVIRLINRAQIYRFATKPIRAGAFRLAVSAAMREHRRFRAHPLLAARHAVSAAAVSEQETAVAGMVSGLGRLRARFSSFVRFGAEAR